MKGLREAASSAPPAPALLTVVVEAVPRGLHQHHDRFLVFPLPEARDDSQSVQVLAMGGSSEGFAWCSSELARRPPTPYTTLARVHVDTVARLRQPYTEGPVLRLRADVVSSGSRFYGVVPGHTQPTELSWDAFFDRASREGWLGT